MISRETLVSLLHKPCKQHKSYTLNALNVLFYLKKYELETTKFYSEQFDMTEKTNPVYLQLD